MSELRFVLLEDDPSDAELIQAELVRSGLKVNWVLSATEAEFKKSLLKAAPDLVLADYTLPGFDGMAALQMVRQFLPNVPFVFVSGSLGEERAIDALKSGATDYVLKDRLQRLPAVVQRALTEARERQELHKAELALDEQRLLLSTLIDSLPDVVYAINSEQQLTVVNRAFLELVRHPRNGVIGRKISEFPQLNDANDDGESFDSQLLRTGRAQTDRERAIVGKDGGLRWWMTSKIPLREQATGSIVGLVCTIRDITARKELEQEILEISNREQRRLGSDLHDGLGQELTGLSLLLKSLEVQMTRESPSYLPQLTKITSLLAHTIQSTRSLARGLAPVI
jgi:two-component system, NarL family, sensor histidine kinase UhpB